MTRGAAKSNRGAIEWEEASGERGVTRRGFEGEREHTQGILGTAGLITAFEHHRSLWPYTIA